jgi:23S rRNA (uracil1939-C5)-methyltransferase
MASPRERIEVHTHGFAVGGDAVGRDPDGRVVFVHGALPGERVVVEIRSAKKRFAHADAVEVIDASPDRIEPVCRFARAGCGGCGWAHVAHDAQRRAKVEMVTEAIERLGGISVPVEPGPSLAASGFRTTVRMHVDGSVGFLAHHSDTVVTVDACRVAHPLVDDLIGGGLAWGTADTVTIRVGERTGERMVLADPTAEGVEVPDDVLVVGADELRAGRRAWIHEEVAAVRFRISALSFFQARPDGAEALVEAVDQALAGAPPDGGLVDLYAGVGLFAATVGSDRPVVAVESARSSVADARENLATFGGRAKVVGVAVDRWRPSPADAVVADPPRAGLGRGGVAKVSATGANHLALVSCDAGSLGRDVGLLVAEGWRPEWSRLVDMFPDTPHVEVVTRFTR